MKYHFITFYLKIFFVCEKKNDTLTPCFVNCWKSSRLLYLHAIELRYMSCKKILGWNIGHFSTELSFTEQLFHLWRCLGVVFVMKTCRNSFIMDESHGNHKFRKVTLRFCKVCVITEESRNEVEFSEAFSECGPAIFLKVRTFGILVIFLSVYSAAGWQNQREELNYKYH